jgi:hypothetical protein
MKVEMAAFSRLFQFQIKAASLLTRLRLLNVLPVRLRRLNPRRLDVIFDLKPELVTHHSFMADTDSEN